MDQTFDEVVLGSFGDGPFVSVPLFQKEQGDRNKRTVPKQTGPEAEG